jgi:hypothetical protein
MRAAPLTLFLLVASSCHPPFPDSGLVEGDTDTDADADSDTDADTDNPPEQLCTEPWGWVDTPLTLEQGEKVLEVLAPSDAYLMYDLEGQADLCEIDCSPHWLDELFITDSETRETVIDLPVRMEKGDHYWAFFRVNPPEQEGDSVEHCYVDTSAGKFWLEIEITGS